MDPHSDWIAVGSGASGLASALWAAHRGLKAIVIEKAPVVGGATAYSYGGLWAPNNMLQRAAGMDDSDEQGLEYLRFLSGGFAEEEKMRMYVKEAAATIEAFAQLGVPFRMIEGLPDHYFPGAPGSLGLGRTLEVVPLPKKALPDSAPALLESPYMPGGVSWSDAIKWGGLGNRYSWAPENLEHAASVYAAGQGLVAWLLLKCIEKGVTLLTQSPATRLLLEDGRIAGVEVREGDRAQQIKGDCGIFLGTGGYECNPEFVRAYQSFPNSAPHHPPTQTGDGLLMAGELGAFIRNIPTSLSSMVGYWIPRPGGEPEFHSAGIQELAYPHSIVVNSEGKRFGNEAFFQEFVVKLREFDVVKKHRYANIPFFLLFDSQFRERYPFANIPPERPLPPWIKRAESLADLAQQLGIDAKQLQQTVAKFNDNASAGLDPEFGRGQSLWIRKVGDTKHPINPNLGPLSKAPFYGVELTPTESSSAGLYTDIHGRVMHLRGHAIPNLYAGGTVRVRTEYGAGYQAGLTLLGGMTFGRIAVEHALLGNKKPGRVMQQIKGRMLFAVVAFGLAILRAVAPVLAAEKPAKLRTAYVSPIGAMAPVWMAAASSAFQTEGLDVELVYIQSNAAIAALVAGEVDAVQISAPAIVPVVLAGGNITMIAGLLNKMIFSFHAQKEFKSAEQLRGKIVGADRIGSPNDYGVRTALTKLGLKPESDVQLLRLGGSAIQWSALQSKQIAASALTPPVSFKADAQGFTRLAETYDLPYQNIGLVIRKKEVETRAEIWLRLLRAVQRGMSTWYDDPQLSKSVLAKYTKDNDPVMLDKTYEFFTKQAGFNRDLTFTDRGFEQILRFFGSTVLPAAKDASPNQFYDTRIIDKLKK